MESNLIRFGVSLPHDLLEKFDDFVQAQNYPNRSEAIRGLIRKELVQQEWLQNKEIAGAIIFIYDHHVRGLMNKITDIQHDYHKLILSTQHIHLDHNNCLEILAIQGNAAPARALYKKLKAIKGLKHINISMSSTGKELV
jgi:CopG family nickel-responsive transcriptional regulator